MNHDRRASYRSDTEPLTSPVPPYESSSSYDPGDLAMQNVSETPYSPPLATPDSASDAKRGNYTYLSPTTTFDQSFDGEDHLPRHVVKRFDHNEARRALFKTGASKLLITVLFSAAICLCLKAWEGFFQPVVLSNIDVRIFNAIMIGLSLCLGLNLLASLKQYATTFRWSFLSQRYVSLEVFDLILHMSSLAKITKLMVISMPGIRRRTWLRRWRFFKDVRDDGTKWMWLACFAWLSINIGSQILVALLSLFWPMGNSENPLLSHGDVTVANLQRWYIDEDPTSNTTSMEAAWLFGMESSFYPEFQMNQTQKDLSSLSGTPLYIGESFYEYRFFNRDPKHQFTNYILSSRKVTATATCTQLEVRGGVVDTEPEITEFGSMYIEGKEDGKPWTKYQIPEQAAGAITWIASNEEHCGSRCTNFTILQDSNNKTITTPSLFLCNNTLSAISPINAKTDITPHTDNDTRSVFGTDEFARIAAGAISWTGIAWNNWEDRQTRSYTPGSRWSPERRITRKEIEMMLARFSIGAVGAFDDHGIRYNLTNQRTCPTQGQQLDVDWSYVFSILGGICGIQFFALCCLIYFANKTIVRDDSHFSMAMLLSPVVSRIGKVGMNMSGDEITNHPRLKWKKIRYDYREGKNGEPNQVDIFFEGRDTKESRRSWAPGVYG